MKRTVISKKEFEEMIEKGIVVKRDDGGTGYKHSKRGEDRKYSLYMNELMIERLIKSERHEIDVDDDEHPYDNESGFFVPEWILVGFENYSREPVAEEKVDSKLVSLMKQVYGKEKGELIDKYADKFLGAMTDFAKAVEKFNVNMSDIPDEFKRTVDFAIVTRVDYLGSDVVTLVGGTKKNLIHIVADVGRKIVED